MNARDARFRRELLGWYDAHRRELPWRLPRDAPAALRLDPYRVLVSELMLQQTQVSTVVPYFNRFTRRFPTIQSLAKAAEQDVLRFWQGLGYYARARNLHAAAKHVANELEGKFPRSAEELIALPGVGRYTAGALASIAFDELAAAVDGNVARVLARVEQIEEPLTAPKVRERTWLRAQELVEGPRPGDFNSAMMELGATICTPRAPRCSICPIARHCQARASGVQDNLPAAKKPVGTPLVRRDVLCIRRRDQWLIEQRPASGRWASMWQFVTIEANRSAPTTAAIRKSTGMSAIALTHLGTVRHSLTHRRYEFAIYLTQCTKPARRSSNGTRRWVSLKELDRFPLPRPHVKIAALLKELPPG